MRPNPFTRLSIKQKQMLMLMLTSSVALLLASAGFVIYELLTFEASMKGDLRRLAFDIGRDNSSALLFADPAAAQKSLAGFLQGRPEIVAATIYSGAGILAQYPESHSFVPPPFPKNLHSGGEEERFAFNPGKNELTLFLRVDSGSEGGIVSVPVYLRSSLVPMYDRLGRYAAIIAVVFGCSLFIVWLVSARLQRIISEPILHLLATTKKVSEEKDYAVRAVKQSEDELGVLIDGFNAMLSQIQERDLALQRAQNELERRVDYRTQALKLEIAGRMESEEALQQQLTRISLLNQITHAISEHQDLPSLIHTVLEQLERHLPTDFGAIFFYEPKTDLLTTAALRVRPRENGAPLPAITQGSVFSPDTLGLRPCLKGQTVYGGGDSAVLPPLAAAGFGSIVAGPLLEQNQPFGILICARFSNKFSNGECEFLRILSAQVAVATHQATLYTQLQNAYNELRQTQQDVIEQERLRALGKMASGIAHDINNALSPVVVYSELLLRDNHGQSPDAVKRYLSNIKTAGEDIAHIVSRIREFYRRRERDEPLFAANLNGLAAQVIDLTRPRWHDIPLEHGLVIDVKTDFEADLPGIIGNPSELREAITNLVLNAVDAMPAGGKIILRTGTHLWENAGGDLRKPTHVKLEVEDSGFGMDEETRIRCLEPFFTTKGQRGTGLGLAMVYGVAERHEAKIEIESAPGKGTTMRLVFPIRKPPPSSAAEVEKANERPTPLRILCIDDEPLLREMLREILQLEGHHVEIACDGEAGIAAFMAARHTNPFEVVITDLGMPRVDGRQLAMTLKKEMPEIPIIMLTGWGTMMKADGDVPAQVDCVLGKPPRLNELRDAIKRLTTPRS
ncbi:MAG TPA: ATP-binding protein [Candidatus Saccharimonadales bacterium]|nr:ATP-binding protein [Candidatus Saccharimonadales bacterium]